MRARVRDDAVRALGCRRRPPGRASSRSSPNASSRAGAEHDHAVAEAELRVGDGVAFSFPSAPIDGVCGCNPTEGNAPSLFQIPPPRPLLRFHALVFSLHRTLFTPGARMCARLPIDRALIAGDSDRIAKRPHPKREPSPPSSDRKMPRTAAVRIAQPKPRPTVVRADSPCGDRRGVRARQPWNRRKGRRRRCLGALSAIATASADPDCVRAPACPESMSSDTVGPQRVPAGRRPRSSSPRTFATCRSKRPSTRTGSAPRRRNHRPRRPHQLPQDRDARQPPAAAVRDRHVHDAT